MIGVLPGLGPLATISILFPLTYHMPPAAAVIMLAGIYYGAQYGGSTTSILASIPGEASTVVTCIDGYQMALKGRAGPALGIAAFASFIAGTFGVLTLQILSPPLVSFALRFGPPEYASLMTLGLVVLSFLSRKSMLKALMMGAVGILLGTVGLDAFTGRTRFTFRIPELLDGIGIGTLAMGLFGISEILLNVEKQLSAKDQITERVGSLLPKLGDWSRSLWSMLRGSVIGFFLGILPGGSAILGSFVSYGVEKRLSKHPEEFGHGAIEGVAGPEAANNAAAQGAFVPLLTMGLPTGPVTALLLGALMIHGIRVGPMLLQEHPDLFWGVVTSMYVGNTMLLLLNLPLIGLWVKLLKVPYSILFPLILFVCFIGAYVMNNAVFDLELMLIFGVIGYLMRKFDYEPAPLALAYVLSSPLEQSLRQSLILSGGSFSIFVNRPISLVCLVVVLILIVSVVASPVRKRREEIVAQSEEIT
jgi:putative tricarboxylic transport membrane protein